MRQIIKCIACFVFMSSVMVCQAQFNAAIFAGVNSTKLSGNATVYDEYNKGGSFGFAGAELEWKKKSKKQARIFLSAATGASYLKNGYYKSFNFSFSTLDYFHTLTNLNSKSVQIPLTVRLNVQPFTLIDDLHVYVGGGIVCSLLLNESLTEEYTRVTTSSGSFPPPPTTTHYEDSRDVTDLRAANNFYRRFEVGLKYQRVQIGFRLSKSITDLYANGLEASWGVPDDKSDYIQAYQVKGKLAQKHAELTVGFRILK